MSYFSDERGFIKDLLVEDNFSVVQIFTKKNAVRGNHYHKETTQLTCVTEGEMAYTFMPQAGIKAGIRVLRTLIADDSIFTPVGHAHAWKAISDCMCIVITKGPRSGDNYESDTYRLSPEERFF